MELEVESRKPVGTGRLKKTWNKIVEEDMRKLNITEDMAEDRKARKQLIHFQPHEWETRDIKQR